MCQTTEALNRRPDVLRELLAMALELKLVTRNSLQLGRVLRRPDLQRAEAESGTRDG